MISYEMYQSMATVSPRRMRLGFEVFALGSLIYSLFPRLGTCMAGLFFHSDGITECYRREVEGIIEVVNRKFRDLPYLYKAIIRLAESDYHLRMAETAYRTMQHGVEEHIVHAKTKAMDAQTMCRMSCLPDDRTYTYAQRRLDLIDGRSKLCWCGKVHVDLQPGHATSATLAENRIPEQNKESVVRLKQRPSTSGSGSLQQCPATCFKRDSLSKKSLLLNTREKSTAACFIGTQYDKSEKTNILRTHIMHIAPPCLEVSFTGYSRSAAELECLREHPALTTAGTEPRTDSDEHTDVELNPGSKCQDRKDDGKQLSSNCYSHVPLYSGARISDESQVSTHSDHIPQQIPEGSGSISSFNLRSDSPISASHLSSIPPLASLNHLALYSNTSELAAHCPGNAQNQTALHPSYTEQVGSDDGHDRSSLYSLKLEQQPDGYSGNPDQAHGYSGDRPNHPSMYPSNVDPPRDNQSHSSFLLSSLGQVLEQASQPSNSPHVQALGFDVEDEVALGDGGFGQPQDDLAIHRGVEESPSGLAALAELQNPQSSILDQVCSPESL